MLKAEGTTSANSLGQKKKKKKKNELGLLWNSKETRMTLDQLCLTYPIIWLK